MAALVPTAMPSGPAAAAEGCGKDLYRVTLAGVALDGKDRIVGVTLKVTAGAVGSVVSIPPGWSFTIDNDPSWSTTFSGQTLVGAAAITPDRRGEMRVVVAKCEFSGMKFTVSGEALVTADYKTSRRVPLGPGNLGLAKQ